MAGTRGLDRKRPLPLQRVRGSVAVPHAQLGRADPWWEGASNCTAIGPVNVNTTHTSSGFTSQCHQCSVINRTHISTQHNAECLSSTVHYPSVPSLDTDLKATDWRDSHHAELPYVQVPDQSLKGSGTMFLLWIHAHHPHYLI